MLAIGIAIRAAANADGRWRLNADQVTILVVVDVCDDRLFNEWQLGDAGKFCFSGSFKDAKSLS